MDGLKTTYREEFGPPPKLMAGGSAARIGDSFRYAAWLAGVVMMCRDKEEYSSNAAARRPANGGAHGNVATDFLPNTRSASGMTSIRLVA